MPVLFNAFIVGAVITWGYHEQLVPDNPLLSYVFNALSVGLGEVVVLYLIGYPLLTVLPKIQTAREFIEKTNRK